MERAPQYLPEGLILVIATDSQGWSGGGGRQLTGQYEYDEGDDGPPRSNFVDIEVDCFRHLETGPIMQRKNEVGL